MKTIDKVSTQCDVCQRFKRTPSRQLVSMPMAQEFNEAVAMDLKIWDFKGGVYILYLIDVAIRYPKAIIIHPKSQDTIIENAVTMWIAERPGAPRKFLSDNGGEFANESYSEICENFNIRECKTTVESPWNNGLCERNPAVVDEMVRKMLEDNPNSPLQLALAWACHAKNCLQMKIGYSPF